MSKKFSVDFSDLVAKKSAVAPPEPSQTQPQPRRQEDKPKVEPTGILLPIPTEDKLTWISKDLADCSGRDFAVWMATVFPIPTTKEDELKFERLMVRLEVFKKIVNFHRALHISGEGKQKTPGVA